MRYFVCTGESYDTFETEQEARAAAQIAIDVWRSYADPEWPEEVGDVFWGVIAERAAKVPAYNGIDYRLEATDAAPS